ncbi:hypothetical protein [Laspinema olomoucense]|uniref:hypothetical protein n=1 Tax=Laspinema olomoucense TaxID=3231600 RepID=UPI0021BA7D70|nr:hypothetical protein [Laspinema sp. D3d]MCT7974312.1 hypothetical protein [Laspinema sp. D3d]
MICYTWSRYSPFRELAIASSIDSAGCYPKPFYLSGITHALQEAIAANIHRWDSFLKQKQKAVSFATFFRSRGTENIIVRDIDVNLAVFFLNPDRRLGSS